MGRGDVHEVRMLRLEHVRLYVTRLLRGMVERERARTFDIVVLAVAQAVVRADEHLGAAAGQLHRRQLLFVVLFECGCEFALNRVVAQERLDGCAASVKRGHRARIAVWVERGVPFVTSVSCAVVLMLI